MLKISIWRSSVTSDMKRLRKTFTYLLTYLQKSCFLFLWFTVYICCVIDVCVCVCVLCTFRKTTIVTWYSHTEMPMLLMSYSYFKLLPFNNSGSPFVMLGTKLGPWRLWHPNLSVSCHRISLQCMNIHVHGENTASQAQHSRSQHSTPCV